MTKASAGLALKVYSTARASRSANDTTTIRTPLIAENVFLLIMALLSASTAPLCQQHLAVVPAPRVEVVRVVHSLLFSSLATLHSVCWAASCLAHGYHRRGGR